MEVCGTQCKELAAEDRRVGRGVLFFEFDAENRLNPLRCSSPDERRSKNGGVRIKDAFAGDGEQHTGARLDPVRFPSTKPHATLGIEISNVTHAMVKAAAGTMRDLGEGGGLGTVEVGSRHVRTAHGDLPDLSGSQLQGIRPFGDRFVGNPNDTDIDSGHRLADTDSGTEVGLTSGPGQDLVTADGGNGQAFCSPVGCEDLGLGAEHGGETSEHLRVHRGTCGDHATKRRQLDLMGLTEATDPEDEGGGTKHVGDTKTLDRFDDFDGVDVCRSGGIHLGKDGGHPERGAEKCEQGEGGEIDFAGFDAVEGADQIDLAAEEFMRIDDPFGGAGATAGEEDGSGFGGGWADGFEMNVSSRARPNVLERARAGEREGTDAHFGLDGALGPSEKDACGMRLGNADEG